MWSAWSLCLASILLPITNFGIALYSPIFNSGYHFVNAFSKVIGSITENTITNMSAFR